jgi:hypothetical protein
MEFSVDDLARCAGECIREAAKLREPSRFEEDARAVLHRLVGDRAVRVKHREAIRAIKRALAVDMTVERNRKGEIARALGLCSRRDRNTAVKHRAIVMMMHRLRDYSEIDPSTKATTFPYESLERAAQAVVLGFYHAGLDTHLTEDNVLQVWKRQALMEGRAGAKKDSSVTELS